MTTGNDRSETQCVFSRANWSRNHFALHAHPNSISTSIPKTPKKDKDLCVLWVCEGVDTLNKGQAKGKVIPAPVRSRENTITHAPQALSCLVKPPCPRGQQASSSGKPRQKKRKHCSPKAQLQIPIQMGGCSNDSPTFKWGIPSSSHAYVA